MIVTLDGRRVDESFRPDTTLQRVIDQVRATPPLKNRLIVSVTVNDQRLDDDALNAGLEQPVADDARIDLEASDPVELVGNVLRGLAQHFEAAGGHLADLAERLSSGDVPAAVQDIGSFISLWQTCDRAIVQCSGLLNQDLTAYEHGGRPVRACLQDVIDKLNDLRGALEARDMVLLADLVRYELPQLSEMWQALLTDLAEQVASAASSA